MLSSWICFRKLHLSCHEGFMECRASVWSFGAKHSRGFSSKMQDAESSHGENQKGCHKICLLQRGAKFTAAGSQNSPLIMLKEVMVGGEIWTSERIVSFCEGCFSYDFFKILAGRIYLLLPECGRLHNINKNTLRPCNQSSFISSCYLRMHRTMVLN